MLDRASAQPVDDGWKQALACDACELDTAAEYTSGKDIRQARCVISVHHLAASAGQPPLDATKRVSMVRGPIPIASVWWMSTRDRLARPQALVLDTAGAVRSVGSDRRVWAYLWMLVLAGHGWASAFLARTSDPSYTALVLGPAAASRGRMCMQQISREEGKEVGDRRRGGAGETSLSSKLASSFCFEPRAAGGARLENQGRGYIPAGRVSRTHRGHVSFQSSGSPSQGAQEHLAGCEL